MFFITISEKPRKNYFGYKKEDLNLIIEISQNPELINKKEPINNHKLVKQIKTEINLTQKQRRERRWRKSLGYYYLNPEKFRFGLRNL